MAISQLTGVLTPSLINPFAVADLANSITIDEQGVQFAQTAPNDFEPLAAPLASPPSRLFSPGSLAFLTALQSSGVSSTVTEGEPGIISALALRQDQTDLGAALARIQNVLSNPATPPQTLAVA